MRGRNWTEKTEVEVSACMNLLVKVVGDIPAKSVDQQAMRKFKEALMKLPPHMNKSPQYRWKSVQELMAMDIAKPMSIPTVNKYLVMASALCRFGVKNGFMPMNPADGMQIKQARKDSEQRDVFTREDLTKLFHSEEYLQDSHKLSYRFWLPVLGLYTGCRLEELSQLHLDDIRQEEGVWVLDINNHGDTKKLKNKSSTRRVPLHTFLLDDLRLPQYAKRLKEEGHHRLFPELHRLRDGYGKNVSRWFNEKYKKRCGITGGKKDFHSFRHTFINTLKQTNQIDHTMLSEVVGHIVPSITMARYGKSYGPEVVLEALISKLHYDLDLSYLKNSRFVVGS